jgi:hypothetical protein
LIIVPGYPVYYAPQVNSNYFFYDGMYWLYQEDNWYASSWYNGPWQLVAPQAVPLFVLRVPVRYYRRPPAYFHGWRADAAPHWGEHWGNAWEQGRPGWDTWNRSAVPPPAPLPVYQRQYSGNRYPHAEQQQALQSRNYRYQPQDPVVQQHYQAPQMQTAPAPSPQVRQAAPKERSSSQQDQRASSRPSSMQQNAAPVPQAQSQQRASRDVQKPAVAHAPPPQSGPTVQPQQQPKQAAVERKQQVTRSGQEKGPQNTKPAQEPNAQHQTKQLQQAAAQHEQQVTRSQGQDKGPRGKGPAQEPKQGPEKGPEQGEQQGGEHNK